MQAIPNSLYDNILLALDRNDLDLLFRFWRESLQMGHIGVVIRSMIEKQYKDFQKTAQDHHWKMLSKMYVNDFDSLANFSWDKYYSNLFVRNFSAHFLLREQEFQIKNSGLLALQLLRTTTEKEKLSVILHQIIEVYYGDYDFFSKEEDEDDDEEDLRYFLENCTRKEYKFLLKASFYTLLSNQPGTSLSPDSILKSDFLPENFRDIALQLLKKEQYAPVIIKHFVFINEDIDRYRRGLVALDKATPKKQKHRLVEYFFVSDYTLSFIDFSLLSREMGYALCRAYLDAKLKEDYSNLDKIVKKFANQGFLFDSEEYRRVFWQDDFIKNLQVHI